MKVTEFREKYADGKLQEKLDEVSSAIMLYALYQDYVRVSHQESREYRLINSDTIIRDLDKFIKKYKSMIKESTDDLLELSALILGMNEVQKYQAKKKNKRKGGFKCKATKDKKLEELLSAGTPFFELPVHGYSVNYAYDFDVVKGKKVRSDGYNEWLNRFPHGLLPDYHDLLFKYNVDLDRPIGIEACFICKPQYDVDNFSKTLIDGIYGKVFYRDDNLVHESVMRKIGECSSFEQGKIYVRFYNL